MSAKHSITKSDYIEYDVALNKGKKLMSDKKTQIIGFYIIVAINTGLRVSDLLSLEHDDLLNGYKEFREQKTNKPKKILFNDAIIDAYNLLSNQRSGFVFLSQKGHVFVTQSINRRLKSIFPQKNKNISSHSLRKSYGRRVWTNNNESESSLIKLSEIFNHSSIKITRTYLGITQDEIEDVYMNL